MAEPNASTDYQAILVAKLAALWQIDPLLTIAVLLTALCLAWALLDKTGLIVTWLPKRKTLAEALQTSAVNSLGVAFIDTGLELRPRIQHIANGRGAVSLGIDWCQQGLAKLYDPLPLSPNAFAKALKYAVGYTLLFWIAPWLLGASGQLGQAVLLPEGLSGYHRLTIVSLFVPIIIYYWAKRRWRLSAGWDRLASSVAVAVVGAFAVAGAGAGAGAVSYQFDKNLALFASRTAVRWLLRLRACSSLFLILAGWLLLISTSPLWLSGLTAMKDHWSAADQPSFAILFFLGWLPLLNALCDFISVGLTQYFLGRMQGGRWSLRWWLADALSAVILVLALYWLVIGLLFLLRWFGWGVEPRTILAQFLDDPFSLMWLLLLSLTNIFPTLAHWCLGLAGLWADSFGPKAGLAQQWAQTVLAGQPLGKLDAENFADYLLFGYRWFSVALALCLLSWTVWAFHWLLPHTLRWLL